ncbi:YdcF family protein [Rudaea sp.]|uniref:YdcF family protein n=1 Tax=Rudaea sp. TaxID=2136325 RepID=UPI002ED65524
MIVSFVLALLFLAFVLHRRRRRTASFLAVSGIALLVFSGCGLLAAPMLSDLQTPFIKPPQVSWGQSNAIVVLGVGTAKVDSVVEPTPFAYGRMLQALELYASCKNHGRCRIILSGGDPQHHGASEAAVYAAELVKAGVDRADIVLDEASRNTWENAKFTRALLEREGANNIVLVTAALHMKRSLLYFAHFGIAVTPIRADAVEGEFSLPPSGMNIAYCDIALHEYLGIAQYHVYNTLGWNTPPLTALHSRL